MIETSSITEIARNTIGIQIQSLNSLRDDIGEYFEDVVKLIHRCKGKVIITGVGKSGNVATKIAATLSSTGTPSIYLHAADATHGDLGMVETNDVVIAISKSGNSQEIKDLIPFLQNNGNPIVAMTADRDSYLGRQADHLLYTPVEKEACPHNLAPTTSTTVQMVMGDALAICLMELNGFEAKDFAQLHPSGSLGKRLLLRVGNLLDESKKPKVPRKAPIREVIHEISEKRLGATVVEDRGTILGLITDGDIRRLLEKTQDISAFIASDVMTQQPCCVESDVLAFEAMKMMKNKKINHLVIVDRDGNYKGIVHILDFIKEGLNGY
ncbi:MAG: KpsF/GutQ family sugar-phosphate isomerase [Bacteroidetes bacterium]|nr:KpsF/GutQ family sugar-phosphate isomerase [Bacteroidota bacterium]